MAWILLSIFIIVMTSTASKCQHNFRHSISEDTPQYDHNYTDYSLILRRPNQPSYQNNPRIIGRSAEGTNERPNERSFSAHSGTQRVQEQGRRRIESREPVTRIDNGGSNVSSTKDKIVFPASTSARYQKQDIPEECRRIGICEDVPNYPKELVKKILAENGDLRSRFPIDELDVPDIPDIGQRVGTDNQELCDYITRPMTPKGGVDKNGFFFYILNDDDKPLQKIMVEECNFQNKTNGCREYLLSRDGSKSECVQKYVYRKLRALENNEVVMKLFPIPSCCACVLKSGK